jgi:hypothetical protein
VCPCLAHASPALTMCDVDVQIVLMIRKRMLTVLLTSVISGTVHDNETVLSRRYPRR